MSDEDIIDELQRKLVAIPLAEMAPELAVRTLNAITRLLELCGAYCETGDYVRAQPIIERVLEGSRCILGKDHPITLTIFNGWGGLLGRIGCYPHAAQPTMEQHLENCRRILGDEHRGTVACIENLAHLYLHTGDVARAQPMLEQAHEVYRRTLGEEDEQTLKALNNLAWLYQIAAPARARCMYERVLEASRRTLGEEHELTLRSLGNLGMLHYETGDTARAQPMLEQTLQTSRRVRGEAHPDTAVFAANLACAYASMNPKHAWDLLLFALRGEDRFVAGVLAIGSDAQRRTVIEERHGTLEAALSLLQQQPAWRHDPAVVSAAFDAVQRRKAVLAYARATQHEEVLGGRHPEQLESFRQLHLLRTEIANATFKGSGREGSEAYHRQLAGWEAQKQALEAKLARSIPEVDLDLQLRQAEHRAVANALPAGSALVEFVRFQVVYFRSRPRYRGEHRYLAFVLQAGEARVRLVDLGLAHRIDKQIARWHQCLPGQGHERGADDASREPELERDLHFLGGILYQSVFEPLIDTLGGGTRLYIAPDGELIRLPFEALPVDSYDLGSDRVIDRYTVSYLAAGRDILRHGRPAEHSGEPLIAADPDYTLSGENTPDEPAPLQRSSRDFLSARLRFDPIKGTRAEGEVIGTMLKVKPWMQGQVLKDPLMERCSPRSPGSPRILHLATHGFFLKDQVRKRDAALGLMLPSGAEGPGWSSIEDPLLRSGLALAGAQSSSENKPLPRAAGNGLLTAADVAGMDLLDTELVVLSACETGLGERHVGEGVQGLRSAFVVAGARTLVMSLWRVPDEHTATLMQGFYRHLLAGKTRVDALRQAQAEIRKQHHSPYYWAGFILLGETAPLERTSE